MSVSEQADDDVTLRWGKKEEEGDAVYRSNGMYRDDEDAVRGDGWGDVGKRTTSTTTLIIQPSLLVAIYHLRPTYVMHETVLSGSGVKQFAVATRRPGIGAEVGG
jgi:hypothetical protein